MCPTQKNESNWSGNESAAVKSQTRASRAAFRAQPHTNLSVNVRDLAASAANLNRELGCNAERVANLSLARAELAKDLRDGHTLDAA